MKTLVLSRVPLYLPASMSLCVSVQASANMQCGPTHFMLHLLSVKQSRFNHRKSEYTAHTNRETNTQTDSGNQRHCVVQQFSYQGFGVLFQQCVKTCQTLKPAGSTLTLALNILRRMVGYHFHQTTILSKCVNKQKQENF